MTSYGRETVTYKKGYEERVALLEHLKVDRRKEVAQKLKEAREQGDLSEMLSTMQLKMSREILKHRLQNLKKFLRTQKLFRITIQIRTLSRWKALLSFTM